ncbi:MAG: hypothetical protein R6V67_00735 [Spirochaetia bacterium]
MATRFTHTRRFSMVSTGSYAIEHELGEDLIEKAIAQKQISAEGFFSHSASEDVDYLFSSINRDSELFKISSTIRSEREFVDHVDRIVISLATIEGNVKIARHRLPKDLEPSGFVETIVRDTLESMRIRDFEVFTYTVASLVVGHKDEESLNQWNTFFEKKLAELELGEWNC